MLLSRVAESIYWASRYLERAECTARIVREHTNLIVDLPTSVLVTWEPLIAITGSRELYAEDHDRPDEHSIVRFLIAERVNGGSILMSIEHARENLRSTREVLPREVWQVVNDLYLYVASNHNDGVARRSRTRFLDRVIGDSQRLLGIVQSTMSRDEAEELMRLGRLIERADMTTRVLDVRASSIIAASDDEAETYDDVQWTGVLRTLSGLQMFHRSTREPVSGAAALRFLLLDQRFPRSVYFCLNEAANSATRLPGWDRVTPAWQAAMRELESAADGGSPDMTLHDLADRLQIAIDAVHDAIASTWFLPALA